MRNYQNSQTGGACEKTSLKTELTEVNAQMGKMSEIREVERAIPLPQDTFCPRHFLDKTIAWKEIHRSETNLRDVRRNPSLEHYVWELVPRTTIDNSCRRSKRTKLNLGSVHPVLDTRLESVFDLSAVRARRKCKC